MSIKLREKKLSDGRISLYLDIYSKGRRSYEFLEIYLSKDRAQNKELRALADGIRVKRELEIQSGLFGVSPQFRQRINFLDYFMETLEHKEKNEGLRGGNVYRGTYKYLQEYTGGQGIQISAIDEKWLEAYKAFLSSKMKENTANNYYAKVKAVLRKANKDGYISRNPGDNVKYFPSPEVEKEFLTSEEIKSLNDTPIKSQVVKRAFLFACYTGLRFTDVRELTWGEIKSGKIHFRQNKTRGFEYLPLNETALDILSQCRGENELPLPDKPVFVNLPDKSHISSKLNPWIKAAKIKKRITFHCSRHTFATSLLTAGVDLYTVSKLLGHKSIASTAIYAKIVDEKKLKAVNSLPQLQVMG